MDLTPAQQLELQKLGLLDVSKSHETISSTHHFSLLPLLSISGLSIISFGGLMLLKSQNDPSVAIPNTTYNIPNTNPQPTQVPKSIQHYLLSSQQSFSQALSLQSSNDPKLQSGNALSELLNQSILAATDAIKDFPTDFRGYQQRGSIYLSLIDSQPQFLDAAIADFSKATDLNPASADISRSLASLFARKGDANSTLTYLARTVAIEPTKAQNFYDLAKLQQQTGLIPQALETYSKLLPLISDATQKIQVESEISSLQKLASQSTSKSTLPSPSASTPITLPDSPNLIQASTTGGLIIAAPEASKDISVTTLSDSNSLAGSGILPANTPSISISNSQLKATSQVYLSITKGGKNQSLQVLSKSADSFTVGLDTAISEVIEFKWWIVN